MNRPRVVYLASPVTIPGSLCRRDDAFEHDLTIGHLGMGMHSIGRALESYSWDDPNVDWSQFESAIVGTTWDYTRRLDEYLATLERIASKTRLFNSLNIIRWNAKKNYLRDLEKSGCATIPTLWLESVDEAACRSALTDWNAEAIVIKPQVGAGAWRQSIVRATDAWPDADKLPIGPAMVQPFQRNIVSEGELSLFFFGNEYSHAVVKKPAAGDYRIQSTYGGQDFPFTPSPSDIAMARSVLDFAPEQLLYARVDMVRGSDSQLKLMELEVIEPYLYPLYAPQMGHLFAQAYLKKIQ